MVPNNGQLLIDLSTRSGVEELVRAARALDPDKVRRFGTRDSRAAQDIGDHLMFLSATRPEWFAPFRDEAVTELADRLPMELRVAAVLLPGLGSAAVTHLCRQLTNDVTDWRTLSLLAGCGDDHGLDVLAGLVRQRGVTDWTNRLGIHVGETGPAAWRFSTSRYAVVAPAERSEPDGIIGLEVAEVAGDVDEGISWHYVSLKPSEIDGTPLWPHDFVHIVSPRTYWFTMHLDVEADGRYIATVIDDEGEPYDTHLREIEANPPPPSTASLHRYDADLVYRNGHVHLTPNVVGDAGGPPIGLYPNPVCRGCGVLMFHIATVLSRIREYGEGFRSAFICEHCVRVAVTGTNWN